ncbi:hypothetical protein [Streptomyces sp. NPDC057579]|uniref:hypothetical protein n=1 Tax=Streptomyces sp. NPDC057579 TaxID=3346172 RepID=UPI00369A7CCE
MAGVEEMGSFGAALARYLLAQGMEVSDVNRPDRTDRRHRGKPDPVDAQNAARAVPSGRARAQANSGDGPVQIARMFKLAKSSAAKARTQAINQLKTVLVSADPNLGDSVHAWGVHAGGGVVAALASACVRGSPSWTVLIEEPHFGRLAAVLPAPVIKETPVSGFLNLIGPARQVPFRHSSAWSVAAPSPNRNPAADGALYASLHRPPHGSVAVSIA